MPLAETFFSPAFGMCLRPVLSAVDGHGGGTRGSWWQSDQALAATFVLVSMAAFAVPLADGGRVGRLCQGNAVGRCCWVGVQG
jgi:hypothetical protein